MMMPRRLLICRITTGQTLWEKLLLSVNELSWWENQTRLLHCGWICGRLREEGLSSWPHRRWCLWTVVRLGGWSTGLQILLEGEEGDERLCKRRKMLEEQVWVGFGFWFGRRCWWCCVVGRERRKMESFVFYFRKSRVVLLFMPVSFRLFSVREETQVRVQ